MAIGTVTAAAVKDMELHKATDELLSQFDEHSWVGTDIAVRMGWLACPILRGDCQYHGACVRIAKRKQKMRDNDLQGGD